MSPPYLPFTSWQVQLILIAHVKLAAHNHGVRPGYPTLVIVSNANAQKTPTKKTNVTAALLTFFCHVCGVTGLLLRLKALRLTSQVEPYWTQSASRLYRWRR